MRSRLLCCAALIALALAGCERREAPAADPAPSPSPLPSPEPAPSPEPPPSPPPATGTATDAATATASPPEPPPPSKPVEPAKPSEPPARPNPTTASGDRACGGIAGFQCGKTEKCRYAPGKFAPPHPDAMGHCVPETYCDAVRDCDGLMHAMVVGRWACQEHRCAWKADGAGPQ